MHWYMRKVSLLCHPQFTDHTPQEKNQCVSIIFNLKLKLVKLELTLSKPVQK